MPPMAACPRCASELRPEWKFCVACGAHRSTTDRSEGGRLSRSGVVVLAAATATGAVIIAGLVVLVTALF